MDTPNQEHYQILQKLGTGGMGTVYKALDRQLKRLVAIKLLHTELAQDESVIKRFFRELEITAKLDHPHIIKIYHAQIQEGMPQLIMEFIDGVPLLDYIESAKLDLQKKLQIMYKVALAVDYAHKKKIIHRDIKPSNIMVRNNGEPVLMDFGIAKITKVENKSLTRSGEIIGTLQYMAPEQATGARRDLDHRADIYSLGAVLYHLLTGEIPVTGKSFMEMLEHIVHQEPIPLREYNPNIPIAVENICLKALAKNKENRYVSARALANDIQNYLEGKEVEATSFVNRQKWYKVSKKIGKPSLLFAFVCIVVAILFYFLVPIFLQQHRDTQLQERILLYYKEAQSLLRLHSEEHKQSIEYKQTAYQKLLHAWNIGNRQQQNTAIHNTVFNEILPLLRQIGYELGVYWWNKDQDKSIFYFVSLRETLVNLKTREDIEIITLINIHLASLRQDTVEFNQDFTNLLKNYGSKKEAVALQYPEIILLQAKLNYTNEEYRSALNWLLLIPQNKYSTEALYYQGMSNYHLQNFKSAEELLFQVYKSPDFQVNCPFKINLLIFLSDSIFRQFIYQQVPPKSYQTILPILKELDSLVSDMSPEQIRLYHATKARYNIEIVSDNPELSFVLGQEILKLSNLCIQDDPLNHSHYIQRGFAYCYLNRFGEAWEDYDYAFQLTPQQMESLSQMWIIFPYCVDGTEDYMEKLNSMLFRWASRIDDTATDIFHDNFAQLHNLCRDEAKNTAPIPFSKEAFDKFYQNLFLPWADVQDLARSALINMSPHEQTLSMLDQMLKDTQDKLEKEKIDEIKKIKELIQKRQIQEQEIYWKIFISRISYRGLLPKTTIEYLQTQEPLLKFLRKNIVEPHFMSQTEELNQNWLLWRFLAARILAQLICYSQEYGREFLYSLLQDTSQSLETRIIIARALYDVGLNYADYSFLEEYVHKPKPLYHGEFLDIQVATLLVSKKEGYRRLLYELASQTPYPVVPLWIYNQLPKSENNFMKDKLELLCQQALEGNNIQLKALAILNCAVISRYRNENSGKELINIPEVCLKAIRQHQHPILQKSALSFLTGARYYINEQCYAEIKNLLHSPNYDVKLLSISTLSGFAETAVFDIIGQKNVSFIEQAAYFYGISRGNEIRNNIYKTIQVFFVMLKESENSITRSMLYNLMCHYLTNIKEVITDAKARLLIDIEVQRINLSFLREKDHTILFWTLAGMSRLPNISPHNIKYIQQIGQEKNMPLHIRKMAKSLLLYATISEPKQNQQIFNQILSEIRNSQNDPDELWQAVLFGYKQTLHNKNNDFRPIFYVIGNTDTCQIWEYTLLCFQKNIMDPHLCSRFQISLENMITTLEVTSQRTAKQSKQLTELIYLLSLVYLQNNNLKSAQELLARSNYYLADIRLAHLWVQIRPSDLEKLIQHWQNVPNLTCYEKALLVRLQVQQAKNNRDAKQVNSLLLQQYIIAPSDPLSLVLLAENYAEQNNFEEAYNMLNHTLYLSEQNPRASWTKGKVLAMQKRYAESYQAIVDHIGYSYRAPYPIRPQDFETDYFKNVDCGTLYYFLADSASACYAHGEVIVWLEHALKKRIPIPKQLRPGTPAYSQLQQYRQNPQFNQLWKQLEALPKS